MHATELADNIGPELMARVTHRAVVAEREISSTRVGRPAVIGTNRRQSDPCLKLARRLLLGRLIRLGSAAPAAAPDVTSAALPATAVSAHPDPLNDLLATGPVRITRSATQADDEADQRGVVVEPESADFVDGVDPQCSIQNRPAQYSIT